MTLDTTLQGSPGSLRQVADWLRSDFGHAADAMATDVYRQRSQLASGWQGEAGEAFASRATTLASTADRMALSAGESATNLDALATALQRSQDGLEDVRADARAAGLRVDGNLIHEPTAPASPGPTPPPDATPGEVRAHQSAVADVEAYQRLVEAWNTAVRATDAYFADWSAALDDAARTWGEHDADLVGMTTDFVTAGISTTLITKLAPVLAGQAEAETALAQSLRSHAGAMVRDGHFVGGSTSNYYELLAGSDAAEARAAQYAAMADDVKLPSAISRGLGALGVLATGYAIYSDLEDGESTEQAVVSNGVGMAAAIGATAGSGALVGAAVGSVIPVAGTAVGAVVGTVVGTGVGIITSGAIDSMWENGVDDIGDVGTAITDGWHDLESDVAAVGDLAEDAWHAIF